jgi:hypothetical protein
MNFSKDDASIESVFSDDLINLAKQGQTIGLTRITPVGVGCPLYSTPAEWTVSHELSATETTSSLHRALKALIDNTFQEEKVLVKQIARSVRSSTSDVFAAFQNTAEIGKSSRNSDGRVRRAHVMTCLVDRLLWACRNQSAESPSPPIQFPHHAYPNDTNFNKYLDFVGEWPRLVAQFGSAMNEMDLDISLETIAAPTDSLFYTMKSSSRRRVKNTVIDNISRCALALRTLTCVRIISVFTQYRSFSFACVSSLFSTTTQTTI